MVDPDHVLTIRNVSLATLSSDTESIKKFSCTGALI